jgi:hypothetical protein
MDSRITAAIHEALRAAPLQPITRNLNCDQEICTCIWLPARRGEAVGQECISTTYDLSVSLQASIGIQQASSQMASNSQAAWGIAMDPALF